MASWKVVCFLALLALGVNSQISFGEEEDEFVVSPKSPQVAVKTAESNEKIDDEILQVRYGLIAGFLSKYTYLDSCFAYGCFY